MDTDNTNHPSADDVTDEELAAALALIKKRRADEAARQQEQQTLPAVPIPVPPAVPVPSPAASASGVWPPAPTSPRREAAARSSGTLAALVPTELPPPVVGACPSCKRKLLTRTSMLCNWCGAKINNDDYQEYAARTRQEMDAAVRDAAAARAQTATERGLLARLKRRIKPGDASPPSET